MKSICVRLNASRRVNIDVVSNGTLGEQRIGNETFIATTVPDQGLVFYDWLVDEQGMIEGFQINAGYPEQMIVDLADRPYFEQTPLPRLYFSDERRLRELGLEAFGDISILRSDDANWMFIVGLDEWLSDEHRSQLRRFAN